MDLQALRTKAIDVVKEKLRNSVGDDLLIVKTISNTLILCNSSAFLTHNLDDVYLTLQPVTNICLLVLNLFLCLFILFIVEKTLSSAFCLIEHVFNITISAFIKSAISI